MRGTRVRIAATSLKVFRLKQFSLELLYHRFHCIALLICEVPYIHLFLFGGVCIFVWLINLYIGRLSLLLLWLLWVLLLVLRVSWVKQWLELFIIVFNFLIPIKKRMSRFFFRTTLTLNFIPILRGKRALGISFLRFASRWLETKEVFKVIFIKVDRLYWILWADRWDIQFKQRLINHLLFASSSEPLVVHEKIFLLWLSNFYLIFTLTLWVLRTPIVGLL